MPTRTFTCFACGHEGNTDWTEDEAWAESEKAYGLRPKNVEAAPTCDSCHWGIKTILAVYGVKATWEESSVPSPNPLTDLSIHCFRCHRMPNEIEEYREAVLEDVPRATALACAAYVVAEEGTYNKTNGHFACTECYIALGMPTVEGGRWTAP